MVSSFDIFDTCLIRKCGTPENIFEVLSFRAFCGEAEEWARQEFVAARRVAEQLAAEADPHYTLQDIWNTFSWTHPLLKSSEELYRLEQDVEREMLVPVLDMRRNVNACRSKGHRIVFISDMYLSTDFLTTILQDTGFYQDGDSLYVSCDCRAAKWNGDLFRYVREKEGLPSFHHWHHYGDNRRSDYVVPKKLGIRCSLIKHVYTPYQQQWIADDHSLGYKYPSILAGIGRALHYSTEWTTHTDFVLDIVAPFYCSWIYQVMADAQRRGIKRLYFCARDAYQIHKIAQVMQPYFPQVGIEYVYISRAALYKDDNAEAKFAYYKQIGLATTENVAIVDTTTSGKTLVVLNDFLRSNGCKEVTAYYFILWNKVDGVDRTKYNVCVYDAYVAQSNAYKRIISVIENFFGLNNEQPTVDYALTDGIAAPVFSNQMMAEDVEVREDTDWVTVHRMLLTEYAKIFMQLQLGRNASAIFENIGIKTIFHFYEKPQKCYVQALGNMFFKDKQGSIHQYIEKITNPLHLLPSNRKMIWWEGSLYYTYPEWFISLGRALKHLAQCR